tara:strand:- start:750 stop:926 length:177 start_codon:yes stop_codon:yes gene_type:complete
MGSNKMSRALDLIKNMVLEAKSHYNDGWVMKGYKDDLKEIYRYLRKVFPEWKGRKRKN